MKKIISMLVVAMLSAALFAATFKAGQTVYVSKDGNLVDGESSSKVVGSAAYGDSGKVLESQSKMTKIQLNGSSVVGWFETKNLTKKKIVKQSTVNTVADNIALAGKGSVSAGEATMGEAEGFGSMEESPAFGSSDDKPKTKSKKSKKSKKNKKSKK